jgi:hypothetical protein
MRFVVGCVGSAQITNAVDTVYWEHATLPPFAYHAQYFASVLSQQ